MAFVGKSLADGSLGASKVSIYQVTDSRAVISSATFFNTSGSTVVINIYIRRNGKASRQIARASLAQNESLQLYTGGESVTLASLDAIEADADVASVIDYVMTGATE
jgi:hypothetical protein